MKKISGKLKILVIFEKVSQVAILKVESYFFLHLVACLYLNKTFWFIFPISDSFEKKIEIKKFTFFE